MPNHPLYTEAVKALKLYHQAQAEGVVGAELERLKLMAEHRFKPSLITSSKPLAGRQRKAISNRPWRSVANMQGAKLALCLLQSTCDNS